MDERKSKEEVNDKSKPNRVVTNVGSTNSRSNDPDEHLRKMVERSNYMKQLSTKVRSKRTRASYKMTPSIGQKQSKEHIIKAIELEVKQMGKNDDKIRQDSQSAKYMSEADSVAKMSTKSRDMEKSSSQRTLSSLESSATKPKSSSVAESEIESKVELGDKNDEPDENENREPDENLNREPDANENGEPDESENENVAETSQNTEETSTISQASVGKRDIENIAEAISCHMIRTESVDAIIKQQDEDSKQPPAEAEPSAPLEGGAKEEKSGNVSENESEHNISVLNFRISDIELPQLIYQASMKHIPKHIIHSRANYMPLAEFEIAVKNLYKCCLKSVTDLHELHLRRLLALPIINDIIVRADPEYISTAHIIHMVWSIMSCLHHFQLRLKSGSNRLVMYTRQKQVDKCMDYYLHLIRMFKPNVHRIILSAIVTFYKDGKLWDIEFACTDMIGALLDIYKDVEDGVNDLLNSAMYSTSTNPVEAQKLMQVIYDVLRSVKWRKISRNMINRLIFMLQCSIASKEVEERILYGPLRMGIELCIRHVISNISNIDVMVVVKRLLKVMINPDVNEEVKLNFGSLASYAAAKYRMRSFHVSLTPDLMSHISLLAHQDNKQTFLTIMRIFLNLIDRNNNSAEIDEPRIFFQECRYKITVKKSTRNDRMFFKSHRNYFYELITDCFKRCSNSRIQMYVIFEMCAVILVEIPCGYTAATFTSIAMSMQEYALQIYSENCLVKTHYLHATALSILSLICYIHRAEVFYQYVTNIIDWRAEWAPHLIPPLKAKYQYALHHVLWKKPELFFEDWEVRFGLWKCFRIKKRKKNKDA